MTRLALLTLLVGCKVEPAPEDIDGLTRWFWTEYEPATDAEITEAIEHLHTALDNGDVTDARTGELTDLSAEDLAGVTVPEGTDPTIARGFFMAYRYDCTLEALAPILTYQDQNELFGVYDAYSRVYTSDAAAFDSGAAATISWEVTITTTLLNTTYTEIARGGVRRTADALVSRTWLTEPATFEDSDWSFDQDYQIEAWYEPTPGEVVHLYGIWRWMALGSVDMDSDGMLNTTLNNMQDWDDRTAEYCASGLP